MGGGRERRMMLWALCAGAEGTGVWGASRVRGRMGESRTKLYNGSTLSVGGRA